MPLDDGRVGAPVGPIREKPMAPSWEETQEPSSLRDLKRDDGGRRSRPVSDRGQRPSFLGVLLVLIGLPGCLTPVQNLYPPVQERGCKTIFVVSHGWHTGIIVEEGELATPLWPQRNERPPGEYMEFGWGDARFYQSRKMTAGLKLRAVLFPTSAVLHVVGLTSHPRSYYEGSPILEVQVSQAGLAKLIAYLRQSYARTETGEATLIGTGLQENSLFYEADGTYWALNTCNNWVAAALRTTGFPITPLYAVTTGNLVYQVRRVTQGPTPCADESGQVQERPPGRKGETGTLLSLGR